MVGLAPFTAQVPFVVARTTAAQRNRAPSRYSSTLSLPILMLANRCLGSRWTVPFLCLWFYLVPFPLVLFATSLYEQKRAFTTSQVS